MPPYWSLGFQFSRFGYTSIDQVSKIIFLFRSFSIPLDAYVFDLLTNANDGQYPLKRLDFTIPQSWDGLQEYVDTIKGIRIDIKSIIVFDPTICVDGPTNYWPYTEGEKDNIFIKWPASSPDHSYKNNTLMLGYVNIIFLILI
jgi:alpha-glucosidase